MFYKLSKSRGDLNGVGKSTVFVKKKKKKVGLWYLDQTTSAVLLLFLVTTL